ncbi:MAG TPA: hypothetical protein VFN53_02020 [Acidobacteriaceae bacterium]|nr:hypothetical protein [Acidobacteriaceae bacterium]
MTVTQAVSASFMMFALFCPTGPLLSQLVSVQHPVGTSHGFLLLRDTDGKQLATGDSKVTVHGKIVTSNLVFRFKDGSLDDDTTVFSEDGKFKLISDHHLQKGPQYLHPMDVLINVPKGQVTVRTFDHGKNSPETGSKTYDMELPENLSNGMVLTLLTNLDPGVSQTKVSYLAATPKPKIVQFSLEPHGKDIFSVGGAHHQAVRYVIKTEIPGIEGAIAPVVGKQPKDVRVWIVEGRAPSFVRLRGPLFDGGPIWDIKEASPIWPK